MVKPNSFNRGKSPRVNSQAVPEIDDDRKKEKERARRKRQQQQMLDLDIRNRSNKPKDKNDEQLQNQRAQRSPRRPVDKIVSFEEMNKPDKPDRRNKPNGNSRFNNSDDPKKPGMAEIWGLSNDEHEQNKPNKALDGVFNQSPQEILKRTNEQIKKDAKEIEEHVEQAAIFMPNLLDFNRDGTPFRSIENVQNNRGRITIASSISDDELLTHASIASSRPEIIAKIPLFPFNDGIQISSYLDVRRFEKCLKIEKENMVWEKVALIDPEGCYTQLITRHAEVMGNIADTLKSLSQIRLMMDDATNSLDIKYNSRSIMDAAKTATQNLLQINEGKIDSYPELVEQFIVNLCGFTDISVKHFSNSKIIHTILRELSNALRRHYPTLLTNSNRRKDTSYMSYKKYEPEGVISHTLSIRSIGTRYETLDNVRLPVTNKVYDVLPTIETLTPIDRLKALATILHNELVISAGLGRTITSPIAQQFGGTAIDPIEKIIGGYFENASSILTGRGSSKSYADFLVLNEPIPGVVQNNHPILPLELGTIIENDLEYISGRDYFIEFPIKYGTTDIRSINEYSNKLNTLNLDAKTYLNDLLALDTKLSITPDGIMTKCLNVVYKIASILSQDANSPSIPVITARTAAMFAKSDELKNNRINITIPSASSSTSVAKSIIDLLYTMNTLVRAARNESNENHIPTRSLARRNNQQIPFIEDCSSDHLSTYRRLCTTYLLGVEWGSRQTDYNENQMTTPQNQADVFSLPDNPGFSVFEMIYDVVREIQKETQQLCQRNDNNSASYLDGDGVTRYNRFDDNIITAIVFEIVRTLIVQLVPIDIGKTPNNNQEQHIGWNLDNMRALRDFLEVYINIVANNDENTVFDDLFTEDGRSSVIQNVSKTTQFKNTGLSPSDINNVFNALQGHRKFIKFELALIDEIVKNVATCNTKMNNIFELLYNETFKDLPIRQILSTKSGHDALKSLSHEQLNTKLSSYYHTIPDTQYTYSIARSQIPSQIDHVIYKYFLENVISNVSDRSLAICVGMPSGFLNRLSVNNVRRSDGNDDVIQTNYDKRKRNIILSVNRVSELYPGVTFKSAKFEFDNELYILPGDLGVKINDGIITKPSQLSDIIDYTIFTRIKSGTVISRQTGLQIKNESNNDVGINNILKNHMVDHLFKNILNQLSFINLNETDYVAHNTLNECIIDVDTYNKIKKLLSNESIAESFGLDVNTFSNAFEKKSIWGVPTLYVLKNSSALSALMPKTITIQDISNILMLYNSCLINIDKIKHKIFDTYLFDRTFCVLVTPDPVVHDVIKTCKLDRVNVDIIKESFIKNSLDFDINGYMCEIYLE